MYSYYHERYILPHLAVLTAFQILIEMNLIHQNNKMFVMEFDQKNILCHTRLVYEHFLVSLEIQYREIQT